MKKISKLIIAAVGVLLFLQGSICVQAQDQTVSGNLTVTGTTDIQGNTLNIGSWSGTSSEPGMALIYVDGTMAGINFIANRSSALWQWSAVSGTNSLLSMALNQSNQLILYSGTTPGITLSPSGTSTFMTGVTLSGTDNRMLNQVLTGSNSILTQGLADGRYIQLSATSSLLTQTAADSRYIQSSGSNVVFGPGNLGIGTGTAILSHTFEVGGDASFDNGVIASSGSGILSFNAYDSAGINLNGLSISSYSGDSLIPTETMHILSTGIYSGLWIQTASGYGSAYMFLDTTNTKWALVNGDDGSTGVSGNFGLIDTSDGGLHNVITALPIANGGYVGIGTTAPGYMLDVAGDINFTGTLYQNGVAFGGGLSGGKIIDSNGRTVLNTSFGADPQWGPDTDYIVNLTSGTGAGNGAHMALSGDKEIGVVLTSYNASSIWEMGVNPYGGTDPGFFIYQAGPGILLYANNGKIGLGTTAPAYRLDVAGDINLTGGLYQNGNLISNNGSNLVIGGGSVSNGGIAAFGTNSAASGNGSFAIVGGSASGDMSFASGGGATATGEGSVALGGGGATGNYSVGLGYYTSAGGAYAVSIGGGGANGDYSATMGYEAVTSGSFAVAIGAFSTASSNYSVAMGYTTTASGIYSIALGNNTTAQGRSQMVVGQFNVSQGSGSSWNAGDDLFQIGNGIDEDHKSNAFVVKKSGDTTISGALIVSGTTGSPTKFNGGFIVTGTAVTSGTTTKIVSSGTGQLVLIPEQGDLSMGDFTAGTRPQ